MTVVPPLALLIDRVVGEPTTTVHPVVWMGAYLDACAARRRHRPGGCDDRAARAAADLAAGAIALAVGCALVAALARAVTVLARRVPRPVGAMLEATVLSTLLSDRMLRREVAATDAALANGLAPARRRLAGLVSRDTTILDADQVRAAALESLVENASDSVVAPLWWYAVAGLPGAATYRFVNTADAMWGYRTPPWTWWGRPAARLDDVANWVPARLTAVALRPGCGPRRLARIARATPSPNAGWPMAAAALRWDVRLGKPGVYVLHPDGRAPRSVDIAEAVTAVGRIAAVAALAAGALARGRAR